MTPRLTDEPGHAIEEPGGPLPPEELDPGEMYPLIDDVMKEDWDDPAMDVYDDYDAHRPPP